MKPRSTILLSVPLLQFPCCGETLDAIQRSRKNQRDRSQRSNYNVKVFLVAMPRTDGKGQGWERRGQTVLSNCCSLWMPCVPSLLIRKLCATLGLLLSLG